MSSRKRAHRWAALIDRMLATAWQPCAAKPDMMTRHPSLSHSSLTPRVLVVGKSLKLLKARHGQEQPPRMSPQCQQLSRWASAGTCLLTHMSRWAALS